MTRCRFRHNVPKRCRVCGRISLHDITEYLSYNTFGLEFYLDTFRCEPEPIGMNLMACPKCGYVAHDISESIIDKKLIAQVMKSNTLFLTPSQSGI